MKPDPQPHDPELSRLLRSVQPPQPPARVADDTIRRWRRERTDLSSAPHGQWDRLVEICRQIDWRPRPITLAAPALALLLAAFLLHMDSNRMATESADAIEFTQTEIFAALDAFAAYDEGIDLWQFP